MDQVPPRVGDVREKAGDKVEGVEGLGSLVVVTVAAIRRERASVADASLRQRVPTRYYLEEAVEALLDGRLPTVADVPAFGCSIVRET